MQTDIQAGDRVIALRDGERCPRGLPEQIPIQGEIYEVESIYVMDYGLGCTLKGLDHRPYRGYFLIKNGLKFFEKVHPLATDASAWFGSELPPELEDIEIEEEIVC